MTTLTEIKESQIITEYEPSVADKIQRILYRLEHGGTIDPFPIKKDDNFCVIGLFVDESDLGYWDINSLYISDSIGPERILTEILVNYYGLRATYGAFFADNLPKYIKNELRNFGVFPYAIDTITYVNDVLIGKGINPNKILADIIRSGALFKGRYQLNGHCS